MHSNEKQSWRRRKEGKSKQRGTDTKNCCYVIRCVTNRLKLQTSRKDLEKASSRPLRYAKTSSVTRSKY